MPELLRCEVARLAARPTMQEWLARTRRRGSSVSRVEVIEALDEVRRPWPMLVVDAACLYEVVAATGRAEAIRERPAGDGDHIAPHVIDVEVFGVVWRHPLLGYLDTDTTAAAQAVDDLRDWPGECVGHRALLGASPGTPGHYPWWTRCTWRLAEAFGAALLTIDGRDPCPRPDLRVST